MICDCPSMLWFQRRRSSEPTLKLGLDEDLQHRVVCTYISHKLRVGLDTALSNHPPPPLLSIAAYMRQWITSVLVQIMACRSSAKLRPSCPGRDELKSILDTCLISCWHISHWTFIEHIKTMLYCVIKFGVQEKYIGPVNKCALSVNIMQMINRDLNVFMAVTISHDLHKQITYINTLPSSYWSNFDTARRLKEPSD